MVYIQKLRAISDTCFYEKALRSIQTGRLFYSPALRSVKDA